MTYLWGKEQNSCPKQRRSDQRSKYRYDDHPKRYTNNFKNKITYRPCGFFFISVRSEQSEKNIDDDTDPIEEGQDNKCYTNDPDLDVERLGEPIADASQHRSLSIDDA